MSSLLVSNETRGNRKRVKYSLADILQVVLTEPKLFVASWRRVGNDSPRRQSRLALRGGATAGAVNYLIGDPSQWHRAISLYRAYDTERLPGIDLVYYAGTEV